MAVQEGPTSIRISWSPPSLQGDTSGYRVSYNGGSSGSVDVSGWYTDNHLLTGLLNGAMYSISIVGASNHFSSEEVEYSHSIHLSEFFKLYLAPCIDILHSTVLCTPVSVPGMPTAVVSSTTESTIHLTWSVPSGSVVDSYEVKWERDTSGECPDEDVGNATITHGLTSFSIRQLEESSTYNITVTANNIAGSVVSDPVITMTRKTGRMLTDVV